jgi:hypothetical protein
LDRLRSFAALRAAQDDKCKTQRVLIKPRS